jgi:hypothetical protein
LIVLLSLLSLFDHGEKERKETGERIIAESFCSTIARSTVSGGRSFNATTGDASNGDVATTTKSESYPSIGPSIGPCSTTVRKGRSSNTTCGFGSKAPW